MRVTVSLVTYEGRRWVEACLASLAAQTHRDLEVVVLDNGSSDGTAAILARAAARDPALTLILEPVNLGYAGGHDRVIARAGGDLVCLLNQDVVLDPGFLAEAAGAFEEDPTVGAVQGRVHRMDPGGRKLETIDTTGLEIHRSRRVVSRGQGTDGSGLPDGPGPVFGADGPCPVFRRAALEDVAVDTPAGREYLDMDFFAYKEDVDLAWRLQAAGWGAAYVPSAIAWHARGAAEPARSGLGHLVRHRRAMAPWLRRTSWRNHRLMVVKNDDPALFFRDFVPIAWREVRSVAFMAVVHPGDLVAIVDFLRLVPRMLAKRRRTRRLRGAAARDRIDRWLR